MSTIQFRKSLGPVLAAAVLLAIGVNIGGNSGVAAQSQPPVLGASGYHPTLGDLMNALIQPRHAKLGLAGAAGNWPLASYALVEINQGFKSVGNAFPMWRRLSLPDMIDNLITGPAKALDEAIKARDPVRFNAAYQDLTNACNSCHTALQHGFVVIKVPDRSSFPNQNFDPVKK